LNNKISALYIQRKHISRLGNTLATMKTMIMRVAWSKHISFSKSYNAQIHIMNVAMVCLQFHTILYVIST